MNSRINPQISVILKRYLPDGPSLNEQLESALKAQHQNHALRVTTCGLVKAGKSSLLNALTDHLKEELFATGATRTTVRNQTLSHEHFIFVDTPGLDATDSDDVEAWKGIQEADVLLFVHHPGTGELHGAEVEFLEQVASQPGARAGLESRLVVVLSHLDSHRKDMDDILARVKRQIRDCLSIEPHFFPVSFTTYRKGKLEGKSQLVSHSGILLLREYLVKQFIILSECAHQARSARVIEIRQNLLKKLDSEIQEREKILTELQKKTQKAERDLIKDFDRLLSHVRTKFAAYDQI